MTEDVSNLDNINMNYLSSVYLPSFIFSSAWKRGFLLVFFNHCDVEQSQKKKKNGGAKVEDINETQK